MKTKFTGQIKPLEKTTFKLCFCGGPRISSSVSGSQEIINPNQIYIQSRFKTHVVTQNKIQIITFIFLVISVATDVSLILDNQLKDTVGNLTSNTFNVVLFKITSYYHFQELPLILTEFRKFVFQPVLRHRASVVSSVVTKKVSNVSVIFL